MANRIARSLFLMLLSDLVCSNPVPILHDEFTFFNYLTMDIRLPDQIPAGPMSGVFVAMRGGLDLLAPMIRNLARPLPEPDADDLFQKPAIYTKPVPYELAYNQTCYFLDSQGLTNLTGYLPPRNGSSSYRRPVQPVVAAGACQLSRWNYELPLTHIPGVILRYLANVPIDTDADLKLKAMPTALSAVTAAATSIYTNFTGQALGNYFNMTDDDLAYVNSGQCDLATQYSYENLLQSVAYINNLTLVANLSDVAQAAQNCLYGNKPLPPSLIPCLDFSLDADQVLQLKNDTNSIFGSEEICRLYLTPPIKACINGIEHCDVNESDACYCSARNLLSLSVFARLFYLCSEIFPRQPFNEMQQ